MALTVSEYVRLLKRRGLTQADIARTIGVTQGAVSHWITGDSMPSVEQAARIAHEYDLEGFAEVVREARTRTCGECGTSFLTRPHQAYTKVAYCTPQCRMRAANDRNRHPRMLNHTKRLQFDLARARSEREELRVAVAAFCRSCEWDGVCKDAECQLRPVSPLPLAKADAA